MKQYQPSQKLQEAIQKFINGVKELDPSAQVQVAYSDRDMLMRVVSHKYNQFTEYAVWDNLLTGKIEGASL